MAVSSTGPDWQSFSREGDRPMRADARRNRERVIKAAMQIFAERGVLGTMEQVAERAQVAKGTVYRSFPNRDALIEAIAAYQFAQVEALAHAALESGQEPVVAFIDLVRKVFDYNRENGLYIEVIQRGEMSAALLQAQARQRLALAMALDRCRATRSVWTDITPDDLFLMMGGVSFRLRMMSASAAEWRRGADLVLRSTGVSLEVLDGPSDGPFDGPES